MSKKIEFHKVRGVAEIINTTFEFTKENMKALFKAILFISGPFILIGSLVYGYFMYTVGKLATQAVAIVPGIPPSNPFASMAIEITLVIVVLLIAFFLFYAVVYEYIDIYVNQNLNTIETSDVWKAIRKDFWLLVRTGLGLMIVLFLNMLFVGFVGGIILGIGAIFSIMTSPVVIFIFIIPIYVLMFYMLVPFSLIFNIRINERKRFWNAVTQCKKLIADNRMRTMGVIFLSILLQFILSFVLNIPNYIMQYINTNTDQKMDFGWLSFVSAGLILIASFAIGTISIIAINLQYFNLVERKQAPSLLNKIEGLGSTPKIAPTGNEETY